MVRAFSGEGSVKVRISLTMNMEFAFEYILRRISSNSSCTVVPTKSDSDVIFCLQLFSRTLTCTFHLS